MDERKAVKVLKEATLTFTFSSSSPFWKIETKPFEYSISKSSSKELSQTIYIVYIRASLMFKASTEERVVMI